MIDKIIITFLPGTFQRNAVMDAVSIAARYDCDVEFEFGGVKTKVVQDKEIKGLYRIEYNYDGSRLIEKVKVVTEDKSDESQNTKPPMKYIEGEKK